MVRDEHARFNANHTRFDTNHSRLDAGVIAPAVGADALGGPARKRHEAASVRRKVETSVPAVGDGVLDIPTRLFHERESVG